jgi:DNA-binding transcriptional regulator YhcF (GntR family)
MNFNENQIIYLQIADLINEQILLNKWKEEDKIPSVRELAVELQVNPNTVMRAYDFLQQKGIIYNKRGLGNYVSATAGEKILEIRKEKFLHSELPLVFRNLYLLNIGFGELETLYKKYIDTNFKTS